MKLQVILIFAFFASLCNCITCTTNNTYLTSHESGHFGCDSYQHYLNITWIIEPSYTLEKVLLSFDRFDTEANYDFVYVYDGANILAPLLGQFSGSVIPGPFQSSSNAITVNFRSDPYVQGTGFSGHWSTFVVEDGATSCDSSQHYDLSGSTGSLGCNGYSTNIESSWSITGETGEIITLSFDTFDTELSDVLKVYDGTSSSARLVGTFSGYDLPPPITASSNQLYLEFSSDYSLTGAGFSASWESIYQFVDPCYNSTRQILYEPEGYIGCPYGYGNAVNSTWSISIVGDVVIRLNFLAFDIESQYDYVSVFDGASQSSPMIGAYTGTDLPAPITSSSNRLFIVFTSNPTNTGNGFTASYHSFHALQADGCASNGEYVLTNPEDSIGCNGYLGGVSISWTLQPQAHQVISLTWLSFNLLEGDTISVYNGDAKVESQLVYSVTGNELPTPVTSTQGPLYVYFHSQSNHNGASNGFSGVYQSVSVIATDPTDCNQSGSYDLTEESGIFGCNGYGNSVDVDWLIEVEEGFIVELSFNTFFTEVGGDFVSIYDGNGANSTPLGSWSGVLRPTPLTSSSNYLYVVFSSNSEVTRAGFIAEYSSIYTGTSDQSCFTSSENFLTDPEGEFGCDGYGGDVQIEWTITTPSNTEIYLEFSQFQTEFNYDYVLIRDGVNGAIIGNFSGYTIPSAVHSTSNSLYVVFSSDDSIQYDGFRAHYHSEQKISNACSSSTHHTLTDSSGSFGCDGYSNSVDPTWYINLSSHSKVSLAFTYLDTELYYDYVKIYDGASTNSTLIGTYSGNLIPSPIVSNSNEVFVTFHSDSSVSSYDGFGIHYTSFISNTVYCKTSHNYNLDSPSAEFGCNGYANSIVDTWTISAGGSVILSFSHMDTEVNYDVIYIYDGPSASSPLLASYSGNSAAPVTSSGATLFVKFVSDASVNRTGFTAKYVLANLYDD